jgi:hypothetical protein
VRRVRREVQLVIMGVCGIHMRIVTMGSMPTSVLGHCCRMVLAREVYLSIINCAVWER